MKLFFVLQLVRYSDFYNFLVRVRMRNQIPGLSLNLKVEYSHYSGEGGGGDRVYIC